MVDEDRDCRATGAVVVRAGGGILEMDLGLALAEAGLRMIDDFPKGKLATALIVDADTLDRRSSAMVRRHAKAGVPVVVITDDERSARRIAGPDAMCVRKPLVSDVVVDVIARRLRPD